MSDDWHKTACILCSVNCGIEVRLDGRRIERVRGDKAHPTSAGLHVREGAAARPLPERPSPADDSAAPPRRRHVRGDRLGHRDRRGRRAPRHDPRHARRRVDLLLRRRRAGEPSRRRLRPRDAQRARRRLLVERARAGEDRRVLGRRSALRPAALPHDRRLRARRGRGVRGQEPVAVARLPARPHGAEGDRQRSGAVADRHRPAPHRDRGAGRHPPAGAPGHRRLVSCRAARGAGRGGAGRRATGSPSTPTVSTSCAPTSRRCRSHSRARSPVCRRRMCAPSPVASRRRRACRSSRTSASSRRRTAR